MDGTEEKADAPDDESNLEDDDFLSQLTDEERECLQYLLETIESLDQDQDENVTINEQDTGEHFRTPREGLQEIDKKLRSLSESVKVSDKTEHDPTSSKMKIIKSFSEDCPGLSITVTPDTSQRSTSSHPSHLRKFDTIMRSGVNVQELRARFIRQQGSSTFEDPSKGPELSAASKPLPQVPNNQKSARQEALQKLGLIKRNQSNSNAGENSPEGQHGMDQDSPAKNCEINQNHPKTGTDLPHSVERKPGALDKMWPP
ncbi:uncharacterized protein LOC134958463 [Pseudophryne corroboree]|uniref:uncharacterized protein LOC134958463 n=1 Tax=Pseudophryne corroboree TaxID=495146 RepID=UPI003081DBF8